MAPKTNVYRLAMGAPNDVSALDALIRDRSICAQDIVAVIAQTEDGGYARGYALQSHTAFDPCPGAG